MHFVYSVLSIPECHADKEAVCLIVRGSFPLVGMSLIPASIPRRPRECFAVVFVIVDCRLIIAWLIIIYLESNWAVSVNIQDTHIMAYDAGLYARKRRDMRNTAYRILAYATRSALLQGTSVLICGGVARRTKKPVMRACTWKLRGQNVPHQLGSGTIRPIRHHQTITTQPNALRLFRYWHNTKKAKTSAKSHMK